MNSKEIVTRKEIQCSGTQVVMNASNYFSTVCTKFTLSHFVLSKARKSTLTK